VNTFQDVINELGPALLRVAASYERNSALQEELVQEILLAVFKALPTLREPAKRRSFVLRIAHNCCVDHVVRSVAAPDGVAVSESLSESLPGAEASPEQQLLSQETSFRLMKAVRGLDLPYRQVMTLLLEDMSYLEIAETLGISIDNVGVRVRRAKIRLKELMSHER
jgi:RNA polymerase sigma factor (sigma-70 family)